MQIISGRLKGRRLDSLPGKEIRPTSAMARSAIFNILTHGRFYGEGNPIIDSHVVDIFCGTGALGFEALSRGASHITFVDQSQKSIDIARQNAQKLGEMENVTFVRSDSTKIPRAIKPCSLAFLDPPYESGLAIKGLESLKIGGWLKPNAIVVVEIAKREDFPEVEKLQKIDERIYNSTKIIILEFID